MSKLVINDREWFKTPCVEINDFNLASDILQELLKELLKHPTGVGLAANQMGYNYKIAVVKLSNKDALMLVNPIIVSKSKKTVKSTEGCLSFPNVFVDCRRHESIVIKASPSDPEVEYTGTDAIVIQHEIMHLEGLLMFDCKYVNSNGKFTPKKKRRKK